VEKRGEKGGEKGTGGEKRRKGDVVDYVELLC
jgi:hypothetical protein